MDEHTTDKLARDEHELRKFLDDVYVRMEDSVFRRNFIEFTMLKQPYKLFTPRQAFRFGALCYVMGVVIAVVGSVVCAQFASMWATVAVSIVVGTVCGWVFIRLLVNLLRQIST